MVSDHVVLEYLYRDASNYKAYGEALFTGLLRENTASLVKDLLVDGLYFLPGRVGIDTLHDTLFKLSGGPIEDDHPWHEFVDLRPATAEEVARMKVTCSIDVFLQRLGSYPSNSTPTEFNTPASIP